MSIRHKKNQCFATEALLSIKRLNEELVLLECAWSGPAPQPGQFFMLRPCRSSVLLGRPISVLGWSPPEGRGQAGRLRFLIARRGRGTAELAETRVGDSLELNGPIGKSWPLSESGIALIGGGIGLAPLVFLAESLPPLTYDFYAGFRSTPYCLEAVAARRLVIASEDGSAGERGRIPDYFDASRYDRVYACGPDAMLRVIAEACRRAGVQCYLSLERRMACGAGACLGCTVRTVNGNRRCCVDGPIFDAEELLFDE